jgi:hypothetical protein
MKFILGIILMALVLSGDTREIYLSLDKEVRRTIDKNMQALSKQLDNSLEELVDNIDNYSLDRPSLTTKQVNDQLDTLRKDGGGMFDDFTKSVSGSVGNKTFAISEDIFFEGLKTETDFITSESLLMWQAMLVNTCPSCLPLHGQVRTRRRWISTGGVPNERDTFCTIRGRCKCILVPRATTPSKKEMREPIKIQAARIRKAEKKRGKRYAKSTKQGFLGQVNNPDSTVFDLRKIKKVT